MNQSRRQRKGKRKCLRVKLNETTGTEAVAYELMDFYDRCTLPMTHF